MHSLVKPLQLAPKLLAAPCMHRTFFRTEKVTQHKLVVLASGVAEHKREPCPWAHGDTIQSKLKQQPDEPYRPGFCDTQRIPLYRGNVLIWSTSCWYRALFVPWIIFSFTALGLLGDQLLFAVHICRPQIKLQIYAWVADRAHRFPNKIWVRSDHCSHRAIFYKGSSNKKKDSKRETRLFGSPP